MVGITILPPRLKKKMLISATSAQFGASLETLRKKEGPSQMKLVMVHMCRITHAAHTGRGELHITQEEDKKKLKKEAGQVPVVKHSVLHIIIIIRITGLQDVELITQNQIVQQEIVRL